MQFILLFYSLIVLAGGLIGFFKAGSTASLVAGLVFGLPLLICALFSKKKWGPYLALILTFFLDAFFTQRYLKTFQFMPSGLLSLLSLGILIFLAISIKNRPKY